MFSTPIEKEEGTRVGTFLNPVEENEAGLTKYQKLCRKNVEIFFTIKKGSKVPRGRVSAIVGSLGTGSKKKVFKKWWCWRAKFQGAQTIWK